MPRSPPACLSSSPPSRLGVDVETSGLNPRSDRLGLVQFASAEHVWLIDALAVDLAPLAPLLGDATGPLLSATTSSLIWRSSRPPVSRSPRGAPGRHETPRPAPRWWAASGEKVPDPAGGTKKLGYYSLAATAHRWLGVVVPKDEQISDWLARPLRAEQLAYAAQDARVLLPLHAALDLAVAEAGLERISRIEADCLPAMVWLA